MTEEIQWIDVSEELPDSGSEVLVCFERNDCIDRDVAIAGYDDSYEEGSHWQVDGGFWSRVSGSNNELRKRYNEARALVKRCTDGYYREGDEDSETIDGAMSDALHWVSQEELEEELFSGEGA